MCLTQEAILPHLRAKVKAIHHPGAGVLLELLQRELALRGPTNHSHLDWGKAAL